MEYCKIQDIYHEKMKKDYEDGVINNPIYKPYFDWKFYKGELEAISKQECYHMMKEAQRELDELDEKYPLAHKHILDEATIDDVWRPYRGYGEDNYLYSYLIGLESEITNIMMRLYY